MIKAAGINFSDWSFVKLTFFIENIDDGAFGLPHGKIGVDTVSESFDFSEIFFASEFHLLDVVFGSSEIFDDSVIFFDELVEFDSGLIELNDGLGLVC